MKKCKLYFERLYPYVLSFGVCLTFFLLDFNFSGNENIDNLIDGIVTMESIVIGLIGAIIPVVLSMKNESKFVRYIFENDTNGLFRKYLTVTIGIGLASVAFSLAMYIRDEYSDLTLLIIYFIWIYLVILFLLLTYRSMKYMILIIFSPDEKEEDQFVGIDKSTREALREENDKERK